MADAASDGPGRGGSSAKLVFKWNDLCALRPLDGHFRRALFVCFLHIAERRRRGTYRRSYRCAARVRALRVNFSSDLRVLCAHAQAEADQAQEQQ